MLCHQCGSPVEGKETECSNCGAEIQTTKRLRLAESRGLRISQELKAIKLDAQLFPPGEVIAKRFKLGEMIGKGPFGEVYRARDEEIEADVALKIFEKSLIATPIDEEKFLATTRAARTLTQPNVVRIHESGVHKDHPWVSMQYLEGLTLRKVLDLRKSKGERFELDELEPIVAQVTLALQHVAREFPHGDLKPENIIFLPDKLKITDSYLLTAFPTEKVVRALGDSPYVAPELNSTDADPSVRADVYSLGVILGEMIFGADYTPGSKTRGRHAAIDALCKRATAFDPNERYASVERLSEDLSTLIDTGSLLEEPSSPVPPPPPAAVPAPDLRSVEVDPEADAATAEHGRDLRSDLEDAVLTVEARRDAPRMTPTMTAAVPKAAIRAPGKPAKSTGGALWIVAAVAVVLVLFVGYQVMTSRVDRGPVQLGQGKNTPAAQVTPKSVDDKPADDKPADGTKPDDAPNAEEPLPTLVKIDTSPTSTPSEQPPTVVPTPATADAPPATAVENVAKATKVEAAEKTPEKPVGTECPKGTNKVRRKDGFFCIDPFEFPGKGSKPKTNVSWFQAKKFCEAEGKRLCTLGEWKAACGAKYPYGSAFDADKCNTADEDGFERSLANAGAKASCKSRRSGAYDMSGNAHEWVKEQKIAGGGYESEGDIASCRYSSAKAPSSSAPYVGFRCCADLQ